MPPTHIGIGVVESLSAVKQPHIIDETDIAFLHLDRKVVLLCNEVDSINCLSLWFRQLGNFKSPA